jgi:hypothetical protein
VNGGDGMAWAFGLVPMGWTADDVLPHVGGGSGQDASGVCTFTSAKIEVR